MEIEYDKLKRDGVKIGGRRRDICDNCYISSCFLTITSANFWYTPFDMSTVAAGATFFQNARDFNIIGGTFTHVDGDYVYNNSHWFMNNGTKFNTIRLSMYSLVVLLTSPHPCLP